MDFLERVETELLPAVRKKLAEVQAEIASLRVENTKMYGTYKESLEQKEAIESFLRLRITEEGQEELGADIAEFSTKADNANAANGKIIMLIHNLEIEEEKLEETRARFNGLLFNYGGLEEAEDQSGED